MIREKRGFTLIEVLIVIFIVGVLASSMLLSGGGGTASAEAGAVVSDLRTMKAAALMFYADSMEILSQGGVTLSTQFLKPYVDNPRKYDSSAYIFTANNEKWWVGLDLSLTQKTKDVNYKLAGRSASTGLLGAMSPGVLYTADDSVVYMLAR